MLKAARNQLVSRQVLTKERAPSYFIECLLYIDPDNLFAPKLAPTYVGILTWLKTAEPEGFLCQIGQVSMIGPRMEQ